MERDPTNPNDGLAHLDRLGLGALCRACFLVQAELLLKNYRHHLPAHRIQQTERFIRALRAHRPREGEHADTILGILERHDLTTREGHRAALIAWTELEGLTPVVGASEYEKVREGFFKLPFPR